MSTGRWILDAADAVTRVSDGVARAEDLGSRASRGSRGAARGLSGIHQVGIASRRRVAEARSVTADIPGASEEIVGGALYHDDTDREAALAAIDLGVAHFRADVEPRAAAVDAPSARAQWWRVEVLPALSEWAAFRARQADWIARMATEWSAYEAWLSLLRALRSGARAQGLALTSPEPVDLPRTVFERGGSGRGGPIEAAWTIGRVLLYTAIGVAGAFGVYTVARDARVWMREREQRGDGRRDGDRDR